MRLTHVELRHVSLPLVAPFRTSYGVQTVRRALLVRVLGDHAEGWGECVALDHPGYTPEYVDGAAQVIERFLLPRLGATPTAATACARTRSLVTFDRLEYCNPRRRPQSASPGSFRPSTAMTGRWRGRLAEVVWSCVTRASYAGNR